MAVVAPAAGRIDRDDSRPYRFTTPVGKFLHVPGGQVIRIGAVGDRHGVKSLASSPHIDADGRDHRSRIHAQRGCGPIDLRHELGCEPGGDQSEIDVGHWLDCAHGP